MTFEKTCDDSALAAAVENSHSWRGVAEALGVTGGSSFPILKGHARRLGLNTSHIGAPTPRPKPPWELTPDVAYLRHAGSLIAAAWFALCGHEVSWPLEPYRYDLLVRSNDHIERVQVKTTTRPQAGSAAVDIGPGGKGSAYDPDDIDSFFIIDANLRCYFIPIEVVAGRRAISLNAYKDYIVSEATFPVRRALASVPSEL